jgi:dipeptidyl aminopeptidase/acylaminoacyl peptidase
VVHVEGSKTGNAYALVDLTAGSASIVDDVYAGLGPDQIAEARWYDYKAVDGTELQGVLTLPKGRDPKHLPLVVLPHGGPEAHDTLSFDWWAQALVSRGYAVFQPNFRGSDGYGAAFRNAGFGEWGRKMQTDISDGVRKLAVDGVIDPKRVCIVGASYGGYAALAGVTLEQDVYRCAVSVAGVSDLRRMLVWQRSRSGGENVSLRYWRRFMGAEEGGEAELDKYSPAKLADRAKAPILLIHGKDDTVVPYRHSSAMASALRSAGKPVELIELKEEDHWLSRSATRQQMLEEAMRFIQQHNPAD